MAAIRICRGDVVLVNLEPGKGKEQRGRSRPCVVIQNDLGNQYSPTTIVVPLNDAAGKQVYPFQALVRKGRGGITKDSIAKCEQVRVIDHGRITKTLGHLDSGTIEGIDNALRISLAL